MRFSLTHAEIRRSVCACYSVDQTRHSVAVAFSRRLAVTAVTRVLTWISRIVQDRVARFLICQHYDSQTYVYEVCFSINFYGAAAVRSVIILLCMSVRFVRILIFCELIEIVCCL